MINEKIKNVYEERFSKSVYEIKIDDETFPFIEYGLDLYNNMTNKSIAVLDAGCGDCRYIRALKKRGYSDVKGIDLIQYTGDDNVDFIQSGIDNTPFENSSFDFIYCASVLYYLEDVEKGIDEFERILKDGGVLLLTATTKFSPYTLNRMMRKVLKTKNSEHLDFYHFKYSVFDYIRMLRKRNFEVLYISGFRMPISYFIKLVMRKIVRIISHDRQFVFRNHVGKNRVINIFKSIFAYHAVIIVRKRKYVK